MIATVLPNEHLFAEGDDENSDEESCSFCEERLYHRKMGEHAIDKIIFPQSPPPAREFPVRCSLQEYLEFSYRHVLSEYWAFLHSRHDEKNGWRMPLLKQWKITWKRNLIQKIEIEGDSKANVDFDDCVYHLLVWRKHLCLSTKRLNADTLNTTRRRFLRRNETIDNLQLKIGAKLNALNLREINESDSTIAYSLGYVKPFIEELSVLTRYIGNPRSCPDVLDAVADIGRRKIFDYDSRNQRSKVEINHDQETAIRNLKYNVEAVQGPPGALQVSDPDKAKLST